MRRFFVAVMFLACASIAWADPVLWYCDPVNGNTKTGDGSSAKPWGSFESVVNAKLISAGDRSKGKIHAGDTVRLRSGRHGRVTLQPYQANGVPINDFEGMKTITIEADGNHIPTMDSLAGISVKSWLFRGIVFVTSKDTIKAGIIARINDSSDVTIEDCTVIPSEDINSWEMEDWVSKTPSYGMWLKGTNITARRNQIYGVVNGCGISGEKFNFQNNLIEGFMNDGMNVSSSETLVDDNRIVDQFEGPDDNHHDGIQVFELTGKPMKNLKIRRNYIARSTGKYKRIPLVSIVSDYDVLQGISLFDGDWSDVEIEDNVVVCTAYNAITLSGAKNSVIRNNTVFSQSNINSWICVRDRRDGNPSNGILCEKNLAPSYSILSRSGVKLAENFSYEKPLVSWNSQDTKQIDPLTTFYFYDRSRGLFDAGVRPGTVASDSVVVTTRKGVGARQ